MASFTEWLYASRTAIYYALLIGGTLAVMGSTAFKSWADKRSDAEKQKSENNLAETRHQEHLELTAAAKVKEAAYSKAVEILQQSPKPPDTPANPTGKTNFDDVDARLNAALREVAPAQAIRLKEEAAAIEREAAAHALAKDLRVKIYPQLVEAAKLMYASIERAKDTPLYKEIHLSPLKQPTAEILYVRSEKNGSFLPPAQELFDVRFEADPVVEWHITLNVGMIDPKKNDSPLRKDDKPIVAMPEIYVNARALGKIILTGWLRVQRDTLKLTGELSGPDGPTRDKLDQELRGLPMDKMVTRLTAEMLAQSRILSASARRDL